LYVDTETYEIRGLKIEGEEETRHSILSRSFLEGRYILEYVRENQYLGIFSYKSKCMYKIDAKELTVEKKHYFYSDSCRRKVKEALTNDGGLYENDIIHLGNYFSLSSEGNTEKSRRVSENAGESIHKKIMGCLGN
ncbi:MAG: hypothetical protein K2P23_01270, partial [Lachnospiraceae bacterium]|nr:hypothetical protein [Lachnospiraceae bacterium]